MTQIEHAIDLRQVPSQAPGKLGFTDSLVFHSLVENHLDSGESG